MPHSFVQRWQEMIEHWYNGQGAKQALKELSAAAQDSHVSTSSSPGINETAESVLRSVLTRSAQSPVRLADTPSEVLTRSAQSPSGAAGSAGQAKKKARKSQRPKTINSLGVMLPETW